MLTDCRHAAEVSCDRISTGKSACMDKPPRYNPRTPPIPLKITVANVLETCSLLKSMVDQ